MFKKVLEFNPNDIDAYYDSGRCLISMGCNEESLYCINKVIELSPNFINAYYNKAVSLMCLGRYDRALDVLKFVLSKNEEDVDTHYNIGYCLFKIGRDTDAVKTFDKINEMEPGFFLKIVEEKGQGVYIEEIEKYRKVRPEMFGNLVTDESRSNASIVKVN